MNSIILFSAFLAVAFCAPVEESFVDFAEDTLGNYKLNYITKNSSRTEERTQDGKVIGSYTFLDTDGVKHTVTYVAAEETGFNVNSDDLPVPVPETEDNLKTRADHLAFVEHERAINPNADIEEEPVPVEDVLAKLVLPEIESVPEDDAETAAAKAELLAAYAEALERLAVEYKKLA
ncbi:PREDICTED: cuticle protein 7-like [Nicrophorus vespilloides]|uniref:Cuticle protein 7-like n=1 Tax=Nicrophorus vespilloides TaxID=110193 RepID=A0ABM1N0T2_NICVS|nr:PREDICTED: cuticle protein 7-like [Nicrophorus vespilloides]